MIFDLIWFKNSKISIFVYNPLDISKRIFGELFQEKRRSKMISIAKRLSSLLFIGRTVRVWNSGRSSIEMDILKAIRMTCLADRPVRIKSVVTWNL